MGPSLHGNLPPTILDRTYLYQSESPKTALDKSIFQGHNGIESLLFGQGADARVTPQTLEYIVGAGNHGIHREFSDTASDQGERSERMTQSLYVPVK